MSNKFPEPKGNDSIDCHLQQVGMGSLICSAARQTGDKTTNEVDLTNCFNCPAGKIFREPEGCLKPNVFRELPVNNLPILIIVIQRHRFHRFTQTLLS